MRTAYCRGTIDREQERGNQDESLREAGPPNRDEVGRLDRPVTDHHEQTGERGHGDCIDRRRRTQRQ